MNDAMPELPEPDYKLHDDGYFTRKSREDGRSRPYPCAAYVAAEVVAYGQACFTAGQQQMAALASSPSTAGCAPVANRANVEDSTPMQVGCEDEQGLLHIHAETEYCDICRPAAIAPKAPALPTEDARDAATKPLTTCQCRQCLRERGETVGAFPAEATRMIVCSICGCKRCPHATDHRFSCTSSNDVDQWGSAYGFDVRAAIAPKAPALPTEADIDLVAEEMHELIAHHIGANTEHAKSLQAAWVRIVAGLSNLGGEGAPPHQQGETV